MFNYTEKSEWVVPAGQDRYFKFDKNDEDKWVQSATVLSGDQLTDDQKAQPEYLLGQKVELSSDVEQMYTVYKTLLEGCARVRAFLGQASCDKAQKKIDSMMKWLDNTDLKVGPASTIYHESYEGGLIIHSLKVFNEIVDLHKLPVFGNYVPYHSAALVALTHDWCKINRYESYLRNVKNEETGSWDKVKSFKRKDAMLPLGHGVASLFETSQMFALNPEEALAIRWHMSHWNVANNEVDELQQANETCPLVHMIQFADALSITKYANVVPKANS